MDERTRLKQTIVEAGRQWNLLGILGTTGKGVQVTQKAVLNYLREIGVKYRCITILERND